jgi:hypothetical protein
LSANGRNDTACEEFPDSGQMVVIVPGYEMQMIHESHRLLTLEEAPALLQKPGEDTLAMYRRF